jgi:hypothetical protein
MRTEPINFLAAAATPTPEGKIFNTILLAILVSSQESFIQASLVQVVAVAGETITDGQQYRMELAVLKLMQVESSVEERLNTLLQFVLYGNWQDVGLDKNPTVNALTPEQREGILQVVYAVAAATVVASNVLNSFGEISLAYPALDWQLAA